jgi:hypothetical protein
MEQGVDGDCVDVRASYSLDSLLLIPFHYLQAGDLAELVHEMRAVLMEELDTGIPNDGPAVSTEADDGSSTTSMYAQMLAKARAAKEDK